MFVQQWLRVSIGLFTPLEDKIAGCLERDAPVEIVAHPLVVRVSRILVIDDLVDTGKTLEVVRKHMPKAHIATVYAKPMGRPQVDSFITEVSQDTWIFFPWDMALQYVEPYRAGG